MANGHENDARSPLESSRTLIIGLVVVVLVLGLALVSMAVGSSKAPVTTERVNVLATSGDDCVNCHRKSSPGIVEQYGHSTKAAAGVTCQDCHSVAADYPGAVEHQGGYVLNQPTTAICEQCHAAQVAQFEQSRHALPAWVPVAGTDALTPEQLAQYEAIPEGRYSPDQSRHIIASLEGPDVTRVGCDVCHSIGAPAADGSVGQCSKCHIRHEFSREQVRKPETCNQCHLGPDHPQWEIYHESPHGVAYKTMGHMWNWTAKAGNQGPTDLPAATCAVCHMSGFGAAATTHDVGDRLTWFLFSPISERRPAWQDNKVRMRAVCQECHNTEFIDAFYENGDALTEKINAWVRESNEIMAPLEEKGILTPEPFDEPIDFVHFDLWHYYGRTAKFGAWMQGPDYVQWHGAFEILRHLAELRAYANEKLASETNGAPQREASE